MKISEIRGFSSEELREKIEGWRREVFTARFKSATEPIEHGAQLAEKRRDIARGLGVLHAREQGRESEPVGGAAEPAAEKPRKEKKPRKQRKGVGGADNIRRDDVVKVIAGDEKGKTGRVLRVMREEGKIVVEGINYIWKHLRKTQQNPQGGRLQKEAPLPISKVALESGATEE